MFSLPEYAMQEVDKLLAEKKSSNERCIFIFGSKCCGKSTSIYKFLDISDSPRETLSLDYVYSRKTNHREVSQKLLCHIWEFSGRRESLSRIFSTVLRRNFTVFIFLDLSQPNLMWDTVEYCLKALDDIKDYVNIVLVGAKYDIFKDFDQQTKKAICTALRGIALNIKCPLIYTSNLDQTSYKRLKDTMNYYGFNQGSLPKEKTTNINKALCLFNDSWESFGGKLSMDQIKMELNSCVQQEIVLPVHVDGHFDMDKYPEPDVDAAVKKKMNEIKMAAIGNEALQDILRNNKN